MYLNNSNAVLKNGQWDCDFTLANKGLGQFPSKQIRLIYNTTLYSTVAAAIGSQAIAQSCGTYHCDITLPVIQGQASVSFHLTLKAAKNVVASKNETLIVQYPQSVTATAFQV